MSEIEMNVEEIVRQADQLGASDVHLIKGLPPYFRVVGQLVPQREGRPLTEADCDQAAAQLAGYQLEQLKAVGEVDLARTMVGRRVRVNLFRQQGSFSAAIRLLADEIPALEKLDLPPKVLELTDLHQGLVLVTGETGSGKSTTQACILDRINRTRNCHIITLEDPIEYLHRDQKSIVSQREIAIDTQDYLSALRACLRQAPDVILLGEMRDHETIQTAMTAAETGHLLIATLHTRGAVNTIDRIIDSFPPAQQAQIRVQLSSVLRTVVSQQLLPDVDGEQVPAFEVMQMNSAIRSMIRDGKNHQIDNAIAAGSSEGMLTMDQSILALYQAGRITRETALNYADNPEQLRRRMGN